jgi:hypothetical protein
MIFSLIRASFESILISSTWIGLYTLIAFSAYPLFLWLKKEHPKFNDISDLFWLGFTGTIALLQIWHLLLPVDWYYLLALLIFDVIWLFYLLRNRFVKIRRIKLSEVLTILSIIGLCLILANQALVISDPWGAIVRFDTGNYHLQALQWIKAFPIIPGLGNINYRLAYNNSIFLFDSLTDNGYWQNRSYYVATGILIVAGVIRAIFSLKNLFVNRNKIEFKDLFYSLTLIPIILKTHLISSLEPDVSIFVLSLVLAGQLLELFDVRGFDNNSFRLHLFIIACVTSVGITIKLSFVGLGLSTFIMACILAGRKWSVQSKLVLPIMVVSCLSWLCVTLTWVIRSVILGGYLAFPIGATLLPVSWHIPSAITKSEYQWIQIFARTNDPNSTEKVLSNLDWLISWKTRIPNELNTAILLLITGILIIIILVLLKKTSNDIHLLINICLPYLCSLVFWFINAPDIRFADGTIWAISLLVFTFGFGILLDILRSNLRFSNLIALGMISLLFFFTWPEINLKLNLPGTTPLIGIHRLELPKYHEEKTSAGVKEDIPDDSMGRCWNIPIPCVPMFNDQLQLVELWPGRPTYLVNK